MLFVVTNNCSHKSLNRVLFFLFGDTPASEFYIPTFRNTLFYSNFIRGVSKKNNGDEIFGVFIRERVWLENNLSQSEVGGRKWQGPSRESGFAGQGTPSFGNCKYERAKRRCEEVRKGRHGMAEITLFYFRWLSRFLKRVQEFLGFP